MKINPLNKKLDKNPEEVLNVTKEEFFETFFTLLTLRHVNLTKNEIKLLKVLAVDKEMTESGISKNNLPPLIKSLNEKKLMNGKELSDLSKAYKKAFTKDVQIVINFKIIDDDIGRNN